MKLTTTIILLLLLAITGIVFYYQASQPPTTQNGSAAASGSRESGPGKAVFGDQPFTPDMVRAVTIKRAGKTVKLAKKDGQWMQTEPVDFPLKSGQIARIIKAAAGLRYVEKIDVNKAKTPSLADLQLETPQTTITLKTDSAKHTIKLSERAVGGTGHALIDQRKEAYLVTDTLHNRLAGATINDWRQRRLNAPPAKRAETISIHRPGGEVSALKRDGNWYLTKDKTQRASKDAVTGLIDAIQAIRINKFVADKPKNLSIYGLVDPRITAKILTPAVKGEAKAAATLSIGGPADLEEGSYYARWEEENAGDVRDAKDVEKPGNAENSDGQGKTSSVVFTLGASKVKAFEVSRADLRDSRVAVISGNEVNGLVVKRASKPTIHLQRDGMKFVFAEGGPDFEADPKASEALLDAVLKAKARRYRPGFSSDSKPKATVTLSRRGGGSEAIRIYSGDEDPASSKPTWVTLREGETVGYVVPAKQLAPLFEPRLALRNRDLLVPGVSAIQAITLKRPEGRYKFAKASPDKSPTEAGPHANAKANGENNSQTNPSGGSTWQMNGSDQFEKPAWTALRNGLKPLRAKRWLPDSANVKPSNDWITLSVTLADRKPLVLHADPNTGRGKVEGIEQAVELPSSFIDTLQAEFHDRNVLSLNVNQIESVKITQSPNEGKSITLRRGSDGSYNLGDGGTVNAPTAAGIFDTLAGLRAKRYHQASSVSLSADKPSYQLTLDTKPGQTHKLKLFSAEVSPFQRPVGRLDNANQVFELAPTDYRKLTKDPTS